MNRPSIPAETGVVGAAMAKAAAAPSAALAVLPPPPAPPPPLSASPHLLFSAALLPVIKVVMMCAVGALFARPSPSASSPSTPAILDAEGRRRLAALSYSLLTPALAFTSLAPTLTRDHLVAWLPLAANLLASVALGLALGQVICRLLPVPREMQGVVAAAASLGNAGNLPLVLMDAVVRQAGARALGLRAAGAGAARGGGGFETDPVKARAVPVAYVAVNILCSICTHFSIGSRLLSSQDAGAAGASSADGAAGGAAVPPPPPGTPPPPKRRDENGEDEEEEDNDGRPGRDASSRRGLLPQRTPPVSPRRGATPPPRSPRPQPPPLGSLAIDVPSSAQQQPPSAATRIATLLLSAARAVAHELARPPLLGCALAVAVGLGPAFLRSALFPPPPPPGEAAHAGLLAVAADAARTIADATVPVLMLLLGATLTGVAGGGGGGRRGAGASGAASPAPPLPWSVVAAVVAARLIVLPLLGTAGVFLAYRLGIFPSPPPDRAFVVVLVLTHAVPTALNVHALSVLFCGAEAAAAMARLVLAQYLCCVATLPVWLGAALAVAGRVG